MKFRSVAVIIFLTVLSAQGVDSIDLEVLINRENELRSRIVSLWIKTEELHRRIDATHARIECANKVTQIVVGAGLVFLGIVGVDYLIKKHAKKKKMLKALERQLSFIAKINRKKILHSSSSAIRDCLVRMRGQASECKDPG